MSVRVFVCASERGCAGVSLLTPAAAAGGARSPGLVYNGPARGGLGGVGAARLPARPRRSGMEREPGLRGERASERAG